MLSELVMVPLLRLEPPKFQQHMDWELHTVWISVLAAWQLGGGAGLLQGPRQVHMPVPDSNRTLFDTTFLILGQLLVPHLAWPADRSPHFKDERSVAEKVEVLPPRHRDDQRYGGISAPASLVSYLTSQNLLCPWCTCAQILTWLQCLKMTMIFLEL
jgi:hypothetical protein